MDKAPIYMLYWAGVFMGWSDDKNKLHEWAEKLDSNLKDEEGEFVEYSIRTVAPGFTPNVTTEEFEIIKDG